MLKLFGLKGCLKSRLDKMQPECPGEELVCLGFFVEFSFSLCACSFCCGLQVFLTSEIIKSEGFSLTESGKCERPHEGEQDDGTSYGVMWLWLGRCLSVLFRESN